MISKYALRAFAFAVLAIVVCLGTAQAQTRPASPWPSERFHAATTRNIVGQFDYYDLVLSWSPTHCSESQPGYDDMQCNRSDGRRFSFVLHGLWPQYEKDYPQNCRTARRPYVSQNLNDQMLEVMPAAGLIIHEYKTHGACSGLEPEAYFAFARRLVQSIRIPERYKNPYEPQFVPPAELAADFAKVNPGLKPGSFAVACGGPGNRLKEIRFCLTKEGQSRACGSNENQRRMCSAEKMYVPPVRSNERFESGKTKNIAPDPGHSPVPRPRLIEGPNNNN